MIRKSHVRAAAAALIATALLSIAGCGQSDGHKVSGRLDDVKYKRAKTKPAVRQVDITRQKCGTKSVKHTSGTGIHKRTWHTPSRQCKDVVVGHRAERYTKTIKSARYCVELDDVNGKPTRDDRWFQVTYRTYLKWDGKDEGTKVRKMPYNDTGC